MNCEGCEDIRLVERIFNSPGMFYADTFQRGFPPERLRPQDRYELIEVPHLLDDLRTDKTKPIWNCRMRFPPNFVTLKDWDRKKDNDILKDIHKYLGEFAYRLKNQQEDQSSLQINLDYRELEYNKTINLSDYVVKNMNWIKQALEQRKRQWEKRSQSGSEYRKAYIDDVTKGIHEIIEKLRVPTNSEKQTFQQWISLFEGYLVRMFDSETTATVFAVMPNIGQLNLLVNPMLFALHMNLAKQVEEAKKKPNPQQKPQPTSKTGPEKYPDHKGNNCSKVVFINLDGYESQLNIEFARNFYKLIMYVSFPRENMISQSQLLKTESSRMLSKYYLGNKSTNISLMNELYEAGHNANKNIFVFPVNSQELTSQMNRSSETKDDQSVQQYESNFIYYMFKEVVYTQISDFNPAVILVSYSGKLSIEDYHFTEIIKDLTKIANYKVILFPNLTKTFFINDIDTRNNRWLELQQIVFNQTEKKSIYLFDDGFNIDLLEKLSIFLKVASGTYNLNQTYEFDSFTEKYRNGKILAYSSELIELLKSENDTLYKMQTRSQDLKAIATIINKDFADSKYNNIIDEMVGEFHKNLIKKVKDKIDSVRKDDEMTGDGGELSDDGMDQDQGINLLAMVITTYPGKVLDGVLKSFEFEYMLQVATQKIYKKTYVTIANHHSNRGMKNLAFCQFERNMDGHFESMNIKASNKLLYDKENRNKDEKPLIYLMNYLHGTSKEIFSDFCGRIDRNQSRVIMEPIDLIGQENAAKNQYWIYTDWSYHQTPNHVFLYWPRKYNFIYSMLSKMVGKTYMPQIQNVIFRANIENPTKFIKLNLVVENKKEYDPRYGCSSYSIAGETTNIFIFGGFFNKQKNYMNFQNCVTRFQVQGDKVTIKDVSKSLKIDAVRPRLNYDIQEILVDGSKREIALIGGYGKSFSRPYSLMSSVFYRININGSELVNVKRVKLNKSYCINLPKPIRTRGSTNMKVIVNDESLLMESQNIGRQSFTYHNCTYKVEQDNIIDSKQFEFGIVQHEIYQEEVDQLRRTPEQVSNAQINLKIHRGEHHFMNYVTLDMDNKLQLLQLLFEVPHEIKLRQEYIGDIITLSSAGLQYLTHNGVFLYALLRHPFYTNNKTYFVEFNLMTLNNVIIPDSDLALKMQLKHRFSTDVTAHVLIARDKDIAVLHGPAVNDQKISQYIIKKGHTVSQYSIKECSIRMMEKPLPNFSTPFLLGSLFVKALTSIHCFSLASRQDGTLEYSHWELPATSNKKYEWIIHKKHKVVDFTVDKVPGVDWMKNNNIASLKMHNIVYCQSKELDLLSLRSGNIVISSNNFNEETSKTLQFKVDKAKIDDLTLELKGVARLDKRHLWITT